MNDALIQISRTSRGGDADEIQVEIIKGETHLRLGLTMEQYANLISGAAHVPCRVVRWRLEPQTEKELMDLGKIGSGASTHARTIRLKRPGGSV